MTEAATGTLELSAGAHARDAAEVLAEMTSSPQGLTSEEAKRRLAQHGPNALPTGTRRHPFLRFLAHFNNALIYFLLAGAAAAAVLGHVIDSGVILAVVLVNAIVGFLQEGYAERDDGTAGRYLGGDAPSAGRGL